MEGDDIFGYDRVGVDVAIRNRTICGAVGKIDSGRLLTPDPPQDGFAVANP